MSPKKSAGLSFDTDLFYIPKIILRSYSFGFFLLFSLFTNMYYTVPMFVSASKVRRV
jgi:hypothetical protein